MGQTTSLRDAWQQILQHILQPDERLLWSDYPHLKKLRSPLLSKEGFSDLLSIGITTITLTALAYGTRSLFDHKWANLQMYMTAFLLVFGACCLTTFLRTFTNVLKKAPPYWKYTLYAITDQRVMVIVRLPYAYAEPTVLEYFPHDIDPPTSRIRPDGSGTLAFGAPRYAKVGRYESDVVFPGSFLGISHVKEVAALLQQFKSKQGWEKQPR